MVDDGLAVIPAPVVADKPVDGDHEYVVPPVAVNIVEEPLQIATPEPAPIVGIALTVTATVAVLLQPLVMPVTV